jgi:hypothetical protein
MRYAYAFFAICTAAISVFAAEVSVSPTKKASVVSAVQASNRKLVEMRSGALGPVALFEGAENETLALLYPFEVGSKSTHEIKVPKGALFATGRNYIVWFTGKASSPGFNVYSLRTREARVIPSPLRGAVEMKIVGDETYLLAHSGQNLELAKLNLSNGVFQTLGNVDSEHKVVRLSASNTGRIILVDPVASQFRVDSVEPVYKAGVWKNIQSALIPPQENEAASPGVTARPGVRLFAARILSHKENVDNGSQMFVVASSSQFPNTRAISVDPEGRELRRFNLTVAGTDRSLFRPTFESVSDSSSGLSFWTSTGEQFLFEGVQ